VWGQGGWGSGRAWSWSIPAGEGKDHHGLGSGPWRRWPWLEGLYHAIDEGIALLRGEDSISRKAGETTVRVRYAETDPWRIPHYSTTAN